MKVSIVGVGYVGLVSGAGLADVGNHVTCIDIDKERISDLSKGKVPIHEPGLEEILKTNQLARRLDFSTSVERGIRGADVIFIESPESLEEMKVICANFDKPCFANMVEGGRTPLLSAEQLEEVGFAIGIFPGTGFLATANALKEAYGALKADGISNAVSEQLFPFEDMHQLMGFEEVWEFDKVYGD